MPIWVSIRGAPKEDGDICPAFNPAAWWKGWELTEDPRFRIIDHAYFYSVACLSQEDVRQLQDVFRDRARGLKSWEDESARLDRFLLDPKENGRWWVVTVYEWESGLD